MFEFKKSIKNSFFQIKLKNQEIQFDYPADIFHSELRIGSKPILVKVPESTSSKIFISSENSLGIFFIKRKAKIYITRPMFKLLVLRLRELQSYFIDYEDIASEEGLFDISEADPDYTLSMVKFITFGENLSFSKFSLIVISANTFLGWCNFIITLNGENFLYISSFSAKNRISPKAEHQNIKTVILNKRIDFDLESKLDYCNETEENLINFDEAILSPAIKVIPVDFTSDFYEVLLHVLAVHQKVKIYVCIPNHKEYQILINSSAKWLPEKFRIDIQDMIPQDNKNIIYHDSILDINKIAQFSVVFCSKEEYELVYNSKDTTNYWKEVFDEYITDYTYNIDENTDENKEKTHFFYVKEALKTIEDTFLLEALLKFEDHKKNIFSEEYVVININNSNISSDMKIDLSLHMNIQEMFSFYNPQKIIYEIEGQIFEKTIYKDINSDISTNEYPFVYLIDTDNVQTLDDNLFLEDCTVKNRIIQSEPVTKNYILQKHFINLDGVFYFPNERKKITIDDNNNMKIEKY